MPDTNEIVGHCRRCTECVDMTHHWLPNPAFGDDGRENNQAEYVCKHCPQLGDECCECYGDGRIVEFDDIDGWFCVECGGEGVVAI